jgi:DNA invertase Pin-like site-specific DNA recombinase
MTIPAVVYGAKSSKDPNDSVPDQQRQAVAQIEREGGRCLYAEPFGEASASGWSGDRGPQLTAALAAAVAAADEHGSAELWVFHSSRLGRGSGRKAEARSVMEVFVYCRRHGVTLRSVSDDLYVTDEAAVGMASKMANKYGDDLSTYTTAGLKRRKDAGKPVGALPEGYRVEGYIGDDGKPAERRVIDDQRRPIFERIMDGVESGHTFGDISRALNADGLRTRRGKQWTTRAVRRIALNEVYTGATGYPRLIDAERWQRITARLNRLDPVALQARKGGRMAAEDYMLHGVAFCGLCGQALYTRRYASGRHYICAAVREARGTCTAHAIPAPLVEGRVVEHLEHFIDGVEEWIARRADESHMERARFADMIDTQQAELRKLQLRAERAHEEYVRRLDSGDDLVSAALREADRTHRDAESLQEALHAAQQRLEEWPTPPAVDLALDFYRELIDTIDGRIRAAGSVRDVNAALRAVLEGAWLHIDDSGLHGRFTVRATAATHHLTEPWPPPDLDPDEVCVIPPRRAPASRTEPQTFV